MHQPAEFREVKRRGKKFADAFFSLSVLANHETHPRLGLSIATRTFGTAVARNRIKRLARESFRLNQHSLPPVDVTVSAQSLARHVALLADRLDPDAAADEAVVTLIPGERHNFRVDIDRSIDARALVESGALRDLNHLLPGAAG